jgi:CIC family chloride channel protein
MRGLPLIRPIAGSRMRASSGLPARDAISNGFGASVGLEAGYTQGGGGARLGPRAQVLQIRRGRHAHAGGGGAAGAIAAAFDAPLTGAFYAFELIIAAYTIGSLAPGRGRLDLRGLGRPRLLTTPLSFQVGFSGPLTRDGYVLVIIMGMLCGGLGIVLMRGVAFTELLFRRSRIPWRSAAAIGGAASSACSR